MIAGPTKIPFLLRVLSLKGYNFDVLRMDLQQLLFFWKKSRAQNRLKRAHFWFQAGPILVPSKSFLLGAGAQNWVPFGINH